MADSDSDTILGLEQTPPCRQRKPSNETKRSKMNMVPLRPQKEVDDRTDANWVQTPRVGVRRYFCILILL